MRDREHMPNADRAPNPLHLPDFRECVEFLNASKFWSQQQLSEFQAQKIQHLCWYVQTSVPYYRKLFNQLQIDWRDVQSVDDLKNLPTLTKSDIQNNYQDFIPDNVDVDILYYRSTGGSTGSPLTIYMDLYHLARDKANTEHYMNNQGLSIFGLRSVRLYGDKVAENLIEKGIYWDCQDGRKLVMSCYHINADTAPHYVAQINQHQPQYIHTRPSSIAPLAHYVKEQGLTITANLRNIFCDGEYLLDQQRDLIESAFSTRVHLIYGHTEGCVFGHSCDHSRLLHFPPQIGVLELLDNAGNRVKKDGEEGEMVVTGFNNLMFPLLRYRTGDIGVHCQQDCGCGRHYPTLYEVRGRIQDYVVDKNNNVVPLAPAIFNYNDFEWKGIRQFKVTQQEVGKLFLQVVREPDCAVAPEAMKSQIQSAIQSIFGGIMSIDVDYVDELPRTNIGKFRYLDQQLNLREYMYG